MITMDDLRDLRYLPEEINWLDANIEDLQYYPAWFDSHTLKTAYDAAARDLEEAYQKRRRKCTTQLERLRGFMDSLDDDPITREIFTERFIEGKDWDLIDGIHFYEPGGARMVCRRYLERYNRNEAGKEKRWAARVL